jgi:hypothetical protein
MAKRVVKFFNPKVHTGWHKTQSATYRRRLVLSAHKNDYLAAGRAMLALSNTTQDKQTARLAKADSKYFFGKLKKE